MSIYKEILLDHYKHPRKHGVIGNSTFERTEHNPLCGDLVKISGIVECDVLIQVAFIGKGCVISQATASILLEKYAGSRVDDILKITPQFVLEQIQMELGPNRLKCALLPLLALQNGIK